MNGWVIGGLVALGISAVAVVVVVVVVVPIVATTNDN